MSLSMMGGFLLAVVVGATVPGATTALLVRRSALHGPAAVSGPADRRGPGSCIARCCWPWCQVVVDGSWFLLVAIDDGKDPRAVLPCKVRRVPERATGTVLVALGFGVLAENG
jgi:hypothetical protein